MQTLRVKPMLLLVIALALAACGVNYHVNPGPHSWPASTDAPNK